MRRSSVSLLPLLTLATLGLALAGCGERERTQRRPASALSQARPELRPFLPDLKQMIAAWPEPDEATTRELRELADIALQRTEADARTQTRAQRSLFEHAHASRALEPALLDPEVGVRRRAAWLCGQSGQAVLQLPLLLRLKYESDAETLVWIADALLRLGNDVALAWLDAAIGNAATAQQAGTAAIEALRARQVTLSEQPTWAEIQSALRERHRAWLRTGNSSLPDVPPPEPVQLASRLATHLATTEGTLLRPVDDAKYVMVRGGRLAVPLLQQALLAEESYLRAASLIVLADLGSAAVTAAPTVALLFGDPLCATEAIRALGMIGAEAPAEAATLAQLRACLGDADTELRAAASKTLGQLHDEPSIPALRERLRDGREALDVRVGAAFGLRCFGDDAEAEAFLAEREANKDFHPQTLQQLREQLGVLRR